MRSVPTLLLLAAAMATSGPAALARQQSAADMQRAEAMARTQASALLPRVMPPSPDRARLERALSLAGAAGVVAPEAIDEAVRAARVDHDAWRGPAADALRRRLEAALRETPGSAVPASCVRAVIEGWDQGLRFEREALESLLSGARAVEAPDAVLARTTLQALQWQALAGGDGTRTVVDLRWTDLLEAVAACTCAAGPSPAELRQLLSGYAEERARLLRALADARIESDALQPEASRRASAWGERRTARDADPRQDPMALGEWRRLAIALQSAPVREVSARLVDLQRRTASQLAGRLPARSAWCLYLRLLSPTASGPLVGTLAAAEAAADEQSPAAREAAHAVIREFCLADRIELEREVDAVAAFTEASAAAVRSALAPGEIADADLTEISVRLDAVARGPMVPGREGDRRRSQALVDLERTIRAAGATVGGSASRR